MSGKYNIDKSIRVADKIYESNKKNIMFSPLSLNMALGLLAEGAGEDTESRKALNSYLGDGFDTYATTYMNDVIQQYNFDSDNEYEQYKYAFDIANSVWMSNRLTISDTYRGNVVNKYSAEVDSIDTSDDKVSADKINNWCANKTHNMIPEIISAEQIRAVTSAVLVNSVYFEAPWTEEWTEADEDECLFTNIDGTESHPQMLWSTEATLYENSKAKAFGARYMNSMEFIGILPKETGEFNLYDLDIPGLLNSRVSESGLETYGFMPELDFDTSVSLYNILKDGELSPVFEDSNDFIHMNKELEPTKVSDIIQKTKIELDKNGTKASAATVVLMEFTCAADPVQPRIEEVKLDRPFAFIIYDRNNDTIVFIGKVTKL